MRDNERPQCQVSYANRHSIMQLQFILLSTDNGWSTISIHKRAVLPRITVRRNMKLLSKLGNVSRVPLAIVITIATSSYLSAVSFGTVGLAINSTASNSHSILENMVTLLLMALLGSIFAMPVCAVLAVTCALIVLIASRLSALSSRRKRMALATMLGSLLGGAIGGALSANACDVVAPWDGPRCELGFWVGLISFALSGAASGAVFVGVCAFASTKPVQDAA
jgi:hypothetical protein